MQSTTTIDIHCPPEVAFDFIADFANNPVWQDGMKSCAWTSEPPHQVGSTYEQVASFLGKPILTTFEVTALEAGTSISIASIVSTFPIQVTRSVQPTADGCRVTAEVSGQPPWYMRMPGMNWMVGRSIRADYTRLKEHLEKI